MPRALSGAGRATGCGRFSCCKRAVQGAPNVLGEGFSPAPGV